MGRILAIDYGKIRTGLAATDVLQIIVTGLETVETKDLKSFLKSYNEKENVEKIVIGLPTHHDGNYTYLKDHIDELVLHIEKTLPEIAIDYQDENYTSYQAKEIIFNSGVKKSKRRDKKLVDKVSAMLILQKYLKHI